jgi:small subunit ribosomal protein S17
MSDQENSARSISGLVISNKMDKTVTVLVERLEKHPLYKKYIRKSTKLHAHDDANDCNEGDTVQIEECRPMSKSKSWRVIEVVTRAK